MVFTKLHRIKVQMAIALLIMGFGMGWLFVAQFKTPPSRVLNPVTPFLSLTQAQAILTRDQEGIKKKIKELRTEIEDEQNKAKRRRRSSKVLVEEVNRYKEEVGLTERKGAGFVITLADSSRESANIDSIVHAADLRDLVNLLWLNGAEAISVNDQRLVASSSIDSIINTILVNNTKIANPFVVRVIGDRKQLTKALEQDPILDDIRRRVKEEGLVFNYEKTNEVFISESDSSFVINNSRIKE
jgi:uncharacterized protein YlxW (UPF0749 family)